MQAEIVSDLTDHERKALRQALEPCWWNRPVYFFRSDFLGMVGVLVLFVALSLLFPPHAVFGFLDVMQFPGAILFLILVQAGIESSGVSHLFYALWPGLLA